MASLRIIIVFSGLSNVAGLYSPYMSTSLLTRTYHNALHIANALYGPTAKAQAQAARPARNLADITSTQPLHKTYIGDHSKYYVYLNIKSDCAISLEGMVEHWRNIANELQSSRSRKPYAIQLRNTSAIVATLWDAIEFDASVRVGNGVAHDIAIIHAIKSVTQYNGRFCNEVALYARAVALVRSFAINAM